MTRVALLCTAGFADVLTLGRQNRVDPYAVHVGESPWLQGLPPAWRIEITGRVDASGHETTPLETRTLTQRLQALPDRPDVIAISLLFAHRNPAHELTVMQVVQRALPGVPVVCSHTLTHSVSAGGEFERTLATVIAAGAAMPLVAQAPEHSVAHPLEQQLMGLCDGMQSTLVAQAVSSVVREAMDCAAAIFLPDGRLLAQARSLPLLLGSLAPAMTGLLAAYPLEAMAPGDAFLVNDPWSGGTHLPDFVLMHPVWVKGQVRALVACILHHQDVGGVTPGSVPTDATTIHQEGLRIPPIRLYTRGQPDTALLRLLQANSRKPENLGGDLAAQWAALQSGAQSAVQLIGAWGQKFEVGAEALLAEAAAATRQALAQAPDGDYVFSDALDGDGIRPDAVPLVVQLRKHGDTLTIDLRDCALQTQGPMNASRAAVWAAISYFAHMLAPGGPKNHGSTLPLRLLTQPGTIVDPTFPAAVNARTNLVKLLANALVGAWAQAAPKVAPAPNAGVAVVLSLSGEAPSGRWVFTEIIASAAGGAPWGPGGSGVSTDVGNARNTPAEAIESQAPVRMERIAVRHGSGGAGQHAGGCGVVRSYRLLEGTGLISYRGERHSTRAQGAADGLPGATGTARIEHPDGSVEVLPAKARATWRAGDLLVIETAGGGGWGQPDHLAT